MRFYSCSIAAAAVAMAELLVACTPAFNWRTQAIEPTGLSAMFPCKPETVTRSAPMGGGQRTVTMRSCNAEGVTFAVAHARLADPGQAPAVLAAWRASAIAGLGAKPQEGESVPPAGLPALPQLLSARASGTPSGQAATTLVGVWFAQGVDTFAAFVMAPVVPAAAVEPFFSGLNLR